MTLNVPQIREQFPALASGDVFFDNPGGTQVPQAVLNHMAAYLVGSNANRGGAFETSRTSDSLLKQARAACADFLNAARSQEIVFGPNMTTLTLSLSRAFARTIEPGDTIVVTHLDHDANISPWMQVAADRGANLEWVDFDVEDGTLRLETLEKALAGAPRLVAVGYASNALGTINPVAQITRMAHDAGALVFIDAVHYAPHGLIDVRALDCDFLVVSAYKFFGPHLGILYGKYDLLDELRAYKVRPAPEDPPGKFETGTQNHEGIAGTLGALKYLSWIGNTFGAEEGGGESIVSDRRGVFARAMSAIREAERQISRAMLDTLESIPGVRVYGLTSRDRLDERVPTFAFNVQDQPPREVAQYLGEQGVYVWDGNYYALAVTERLDVEARGGMVRVGPVHYNTLEEVERFGEALKRFTSGVPRRS